MAANIFSTSDYNSILGRIKELQPENHRRWGKMNILQMLEHCSLQLRLGLGIMEQQALEGPSLMRTYVGRWMALYAMPWSRSLRTPSQMNMLSNNVPVTDFEEAKTRLIHLLGQVKQSTNLNPHPFFGKMNQKDWGRLIWKHLDHHLKQFGA